MGGFQTPVTHCPKSQLGDPIPTSNKQELDLSCTGSFITGVRSGGKWGAGIKNENQESMVKRGIIGPWSSTYPYWNRRQQLQHPFTSSLPFLAQIQHFFFPPSPLQPGAISPHSSPRATSSISWAPELPHQGSYLPSKDLRTYSGTCKKLTSLRHSPVPHHKSNFTKNLNNGNITKTKSVSPNVPKSLCKI